MRFLFPSARSSVASLRLGTHQHSTRLLSTTTARMALKEAGKENESPEESSHEIDHHKQDLLRKHKQGKGHWKSELASESESAVKADRGEHSGNTKDDIDRLQKETKGAAAEKHN